MNPMNTPRFSDLMGVRFASGNAQVVIHKATISDPKPFLPPMISPGSLTVPRISSRPGGADYGFLMQPGGGLFGHQHFRFFGNYANNIP